MTTEKVQMAASIISSLSNDDELRSLVLRSLLMNNAITITELVNYKEEVMNEVLDKNKEDLSNASALLVRYVDKINTKTLKEEAEKFIKEQGFFNVK